jgi:hypothetical protein
MKLSGVLYLHPEGDDLECAKLKQNLAAIKHLFGEPWLPFFTIAVVENDTPSHSDSIHKLQDASSPFYPFLAGGAKIRRLSLDSTQIQETLLGFDSKASLDPRFHSKVKYNFRFRRLDGLERLIDEALGPRHAHSSDRPGRPPRGITLEESEKSRQQLQLTLTETEAELKSLRTQLEQTRAEYGSLRSELQLNDNTEQNKVVQSLKSLNRSIDDFGRTLAAWLVDRHIEAYADDNMTTLNASNLSELKAQLEHKEGSSSLVLSSSGIGMPAEDFLDLALRSILCQRLYESVFLPFHPTLAAAPESAFMHSLYEEVRRHG